ncbi:hypothetical protein FQZ97_1092170 [compost metagenome]
MLTSLPSVPLANSLAFILPPLLAESFSAKCRTAWACGWSSLRPMPTLNVCSLICADTGAARAASTVATTARVLNFMLLSPMEWLFRDGRGRRRPAIPGWKRLDAGQRLGMAPVRVH